MKQITIFFSLLLVITLFSCSNEYKVNNIIVYPTECKLIQGDSIVVKTVIDYQGGDFNNINQVVVNWTSLDGKIATVSEKGKVKGISLGTTEITATCGDKNAVCKVTVIPKE